MTAHQVKLLSVLLSLLCLLVSSPAVLGDERKSGSFARHHYDAEDSAFSRGYWVYAPKRGGAHRPLVVFLHGCTQSAPEAAQGTGWNDLADREHFIVVYPEQEIDDSLEGNLEGRGNGIQCWNWYRMDRIGRDQWEAATIAGITRAVMAEQRVDVRRVYIMGTSAGAYLAVAMAALYPDLYASLGVVAGCPFSACTDVSGAEAYAAMGEHARPMPVFAVQGSADHVSNTALGTALVGQWLGTNDLADDGEMNLSVPRTPERAEHHGLEPSAFEGLGTTGDLCVRNMNWPCPGGAVGFHESYPYSVFHFADAAGRALIQYWLVHGLSHGYPGGDPQSPWTDPLGPDVTKAAWEFFAEHALPRR